MKYIIAWKSKLTGSTARGELSYTAKQANQRVKQLNKDFPNIKHWKEPK